MNRAAAGRPSPKGGTARRTGHPEKAGQVGRTDYWYEDEWTAWHQSYQRAKIESLTQVDRDGDTDDLVDAAEAARMLRYSSRYVIHANRRLGYFPEPDAYGPARRGRAAPLWKRSTVWAAADLRSGAQLSAAALAAQWGVSRRTVERIIRAARALLQAERRK